ncbi:MAG: hypothetical protein AAB631_01005 [Patescibacteria group bacterium]
MREKAKRFFGSIVWIVVVGALCYAGYVAYSRWLDTPFFRTKVTEVKDAVMQKAGQFLGLVTEKAQKTVTDAVKKSTGDVIISAGDTIRSYGTNLTGGTPIRNLPATSTPFAMVPQSSAAPQLSFAALIVKVKTSLSFEILSSPSYSIDWGDGKKEKGSSVAAKPVVVSHFWEKPGSYTITTVVQQKEKMIEDMFMVKVE